MNFRARTFLLALPLLAFAGCSADGRLQAFVQVAIIDGTGAPTIPDGVLVARDGVIESVGPAGSVDIPSGAEIVDLQGRWLMPGLINAHGHVTGAREAALDQLEQYAYYGVTTVVSLGDEEPDAFRLRDEQWTPALDRARIFVAGPVLDPGTAEEAVEGVARLADMGVDWVKIRVDDDLDRAAKMTPDVYGAVLDAAEARGLRVAVHIVDLEDAIGVVQAGADLVAHSVRNALVNQTLIDEMTRADVCLVPTLMREVSTFVYAERPDFLDDPFFLERAAPEDLESVLTPEFLAEQRGVAADFWREALPRAQENLKRLHSAGVGIAMGTDTGPPGRFQGYFEHSELAMMVEAGLTPAEAIYAATGGGASCLGLTGRLGTLVPGAQADLLVLEADPLADVTNTRRIHSVWIAGNRLR